MIVAILPLELHVERIRPGRSTATAGWQWTRARSSWRRCRPRTSWRSGAKPTTSMDAPARINPWRQFRGSFLPNWLLEVPERLLSARAKLTYGRLAQYAGRRGVAYPRQAELARSLGGSLRSVKRGLHELRRAGLISIAQAGDGKAARYFFHEHLWITRTPISARPRVAGLNDSARPRAARLKSPARKGRARPEESHKPEEIHRSRRARWARSDPHEIGVETLRPIGTLQALTGSRARSRWSALSTREERDDERRRRNQGRDP